MGLWALTQAAVQGLRRNQWGTKIETSDGSLKDTGVNEAIEELTARLSDKSPIQMPGPLVLIAPENAPAIRIIGGKGIELLTGVGSMATTVSSTGPNPSNSPGDAGTGSKATGDGPAGGGSGSTTISPPSTGSYATQDIEVISGISLSAAADGCTITLSADITYTTIQVPVSA